MTSESRDIEELGSHLDQVQHLLSRHHLVAAMVNRQESPKRALVDSLVQRENLGQLAKVLNGLDDADLARIVEALPVEDRLLAWEQIRPDRLDRILLLVMDDVREELVNSSGHQSEKAALAAFDLQGGRLRQVKVSSKAQLAGMKPIWVDLVSPSAEARHWVGEHFGIELPDPAGLTDLESSARFFVEDNGEIHVHSDFLLDSDEGPRGVAVAFILYHDILFSVRTEELPAFRLQRLRASSQPGYVSEGKDVLLDLYAADAEYSADALEDVYRDLEFIGKRVLDPDVTDDTAARILAGIARAEDLNGRIRRDVLDTRRALSFLSRSQLLSVAQENQTRQILRDIESLDAHTTFLFGKINFLMDATVGFININQNKRVSKLTAVGIVFVPVNILAGIGGMSEFSAMAEKFHIPAFTAYAAFVVGCGLVGWGTYAWLMRSDARQARRTPEVPGEAPAPRA
jgi:magnesium transporter